jgi:Holliday junction resolvase RusA-like endonuclease
VSVQEPLLVGETEPRVAREWGLVQRDGPVHFELPDPVLAFTVLGETKTAGSKRAFLHPKTGRPIITDANPKTKAWQQEVALSAMHEFTRGDGDRRPLTGPLAVEMTFYKPRPAGHYGSGRNSDTLRASAPVFPATRPDALKLARAVEDALTGLVYRDDAQIVTELLYKRFDTPARCEVRIWDLNSKEVAA